MAAPVDLRPQVQHTRSTDMCVCRPMSARDYGVPGASGRPPLLRSASAAGAQPQPGAAQEALSTKRSLSLSRVRAMPAHTPLMTMLLDPASRVLVPPGRLCQGNKAKLCAAVCRCQSCNIKRLKTDRKTGGKYMSIPTSKLISSDPMQCPENCVSCPACQSTVPCPANFLAISGGIMRG